MLTAAEESELITKAKAGDSAAAQQLILYFQPLVRASYSKYQQHSDYEDFLQEGLEELYLTIHKFDQSKGVRFSTYARWRLRARLLTLTRAFNEFPTIATPEEFEALVADHTDNIINELDESIIYTALADTGKHISDRDKAIFIVKMRQGLTFKEAATHVGISRQRFQQIEAVIINHLKRLFGDR